MLKFAILHFCYTNTPMSIILHPYSAPCGDVMLGSLDGRLCLCEWLSGKSTDRLHRRLSRELRTDFANGTSEVIEMAARQLDEYFRGKRREFTVPLLFVGTEFQKKVWDGLMTIPYGTTLSYLELAGRLDIPSAVRAVANANGANGISIFAPCHRVIGADHTLTGYAGGLDAKRYLLTLEGVSLS